MVEKIFGKKVAFTREETTLIKSLKNIEILKDFVISTFDEIGMLESQK